MRPNGYHEFAGCHNCRFCWVRREYEHPPELFCTHGDTEPRPPSGSVFLDEAFDFRDDAKWDAQFNEWERWSKQRAVKPFGICGHHAVLKPEDPT